MINVTVTDNGNRHIITDDLNPRIYVERWKCKGCDAFEDADDIVWVRPDGKLDADKGDPYCVSCAPEQDDY